MDTKGMSFAERNEYWDMVLDEYESSGLDRNEYCVRNDIPIRTFRYWEDKLRKKVDSKDDMTFAEIPVKKCNSQSCNEKTANDGVQSLKSFNTELVIGYGALTLAINSSTPMELVKKVLKEVANA